MTEKRSYWGIVDNGVSIDTGTFKNMWERFVALYANETMGALNARGCKITRIK